MLPGDMEKGPSSKSELFESLRVYLDNKDRLQPIIGLDSIIECVKADAHNKQTLYLCEVCICRLSKSDMRNHIMGSLHRYNYIKSWYPHLVSGWKETSDLSKLARPLMDMATVLEGKEGPGDVQLIEVEADVYQKITTRSENDAMTLISSLRTEPESDPETPPSQRIVLLSKRQSEKSFKAGMSSHETKHQMLFELSSLSGKNKSLFEGYAGIKPLIGLRYVVECKNEDGQTCGFLCHCCRMRPKRTSIADHLTSSSHVFNYLMETHPEKVKFVKAADGDSHEFLQSLAEKVEEDEGRGKPKIVTAPESICGRMENKSYNWCVRMFGASNQELKAAVEGPVQGVSHTHTVAPSYLAQPIPTLRRSTKKKKKNKKKVTDTVFNVSVPFTNGALLMERTCFSDESLPWPHSCLAASEPAALPSPESQAEDFNLDSHYKLLVVDHHDHTSASSTSQLQPDVYNNDGGACQYVGPVENLRVTVHHGVDHYVLDNNRYNRPYGEPCYNAVAQGETGTEGEESHESRPVEKRSDAAWHPYQQQQPQYMPHYNFMGWQAAPHSVGYHGSSDATRMGTYPPLGYSYPYSASAAPEPRTLLEFNGNHVHTAPQMTQPVQFGFMSHPNYNIRPVMNDNQPFPHQCGGNGVGAPYQPNAYVPPWQPPIRGGFPDSLLSGAMSSGGDAGTVQLTQCNSQVKFCI